MVHPKVMDKVKNQLAGMSYEGVKCSEIPHVLLIGAVVRRISTGSLYRIKKVKLSSKYYAETYLMDNKNVETSIYLDGLEFVQYDTP